MEPQELKPAKSNNAASTLPPTAPPQQQQLLGGSGEQLNLPPPSPQMSAADGHESKANAIPMTVAGSASVPGPGAGSTGSCDDNGNAAYFNSAVVPTQQLPPPPPSDFDSDTELSIVAASAAAAASAVASAEQMQLALATTNGHSVSASGISNNSFALNAKQQRQQKRRRERAQRLQAERDNRYITSTTTTNNSLLYHASSAGSMGEDSNNSNGNLTSSSNGSNNVLPPTDSIASLLLNPPHSPECNSGLMATPSDSEGESLDEDLLSTSSSSTLLLPRDKPPPRPPPILRRKLPRSPVLEEEIIDGFAILEFKTYEDLEYAIKLGQKRKEKRLSALEELTSTYCIEETKMPKILDTGQTHTVRGGIHLPTNNNTIKGANSNCVSMATDADVGQPWKSQYQSTNSFSNSNQNLNNSNSNLGNLSNPCAAIANHNGNSADCSDAGNGASGSADVVMHPIESCNKKTAVPASAEGSKLQLNNAHNTSAGTGSGFLEDCINAPAVAPVSEGGNSTCNTPPQTALPAADGVKATPYDTLLDDSALGLTNFGNAKSSPTTPPELKMGNNEIPLSTKQLRGLTGVMQHNSNDTKDQMSDTNNRCNNVGKGFNICDSGNDEKKEKLGPIVFPSTPTQNVSSATPSPTTPRKSSDYPQQASEASTTAESNDLFSVPVSVNTGTGGANLAGATHTLAVGENAAPSGKPGVGGNALPPQPSASFSQHAKANPPTEKFVETATQPLPAAVAAVQTTQSPYSPVSQVTNVSSNFIPSTTQSGEHAFGPKLAASSPQSGHNSTTVANATLNVKNLAPTGIYAPIQMPPGSLLQTAATTASVPVAGSSAVISAPPPPMRTLQSSFLCSPGVNTTTKHNEPSDLKGTALPPVINGFLPAFAPSPISSQSTSSGGSSARITSPHTQQLLSHSTTVITAAATLPVSTTSITTSIASIPKIPAATVNSSIATTPSITSHNVFAPAGHPIPGVPPSSTGVLSGALPPNGISPMLMHTSPYRPPYQNYSLYAPYNTLQHSPYLPPAVPSPSASPRTIDSRTARDSNLTSLTKTTGMRPHTPVSSSSNAINATSSSAATSSLSAHPSNAVPHMLHHMPYVTVSPHSGAPIAGLPGMSAPTPYSHSSSMSTSSINGTTSSSSSSASVTTLSSSGMGMPPSSLSRDAQLLPPPPLHLGGHPHMTSPSPHMSMSHILAHTQYSQHAMLRGASPSASSANSSVSTAGMQRGISPKSESPSKERDNNYSMQRGNMHSGPMSTSYMSAVSAGGPHMPATYSTVSALHPTHTIPTSTMVSTHPSASSSSLLYTSKAPHWQSSSLQLSSPTTTTAPNASVLSTRPTPPPQINFSSSSASLATSSPQTTHSTQHFAAPLPPTPQALGSSTSISSSATSMTAISSAITTLSTNTSVTTTTASATPHPFSAESLFQPSKNDQADLLRRELDSRFLDRSGLAVPPHPSAYLRQELHHHQHQHTHLHQHQQLMPSALPAAPPAPAPIFPPPLFKDIPKIATVDTPFYRTGLNLPGYTGYSPASLLHPGLGGPTPFMPPNHLTSFAPKPIPPSSSSTNPPTSLDSSKSTKFTKTGRWNAMHVRIAWEIYYHQNKQNPDKLIGTPAASSSNSGVSVSQSGGSSGLSANTAAAVSSLGMKPSPALSLSSSASPHMLHRPGELPPAAAYSNVMPGRSPFETSPLSASFIGAPPSHIGTAVTPFGRYVGPFGFAGLSHFGREIPLGGTLHDPWRTALQRTVPFHPVGAANPSGWLPMKPEPNALDNARREAEEREQRERDMRERDRVRREREERERKEKEEKLKREQQERERERKERERREIERRELERERLLQQQRIKESNKMAAAAAAAMNTTTRDRSPHRSVSDMGGVPSGEIRIKEEHPRIQKEEQDAMMMRATAVAAAAADPRYHQSLSAAQVNAAHHASFIVSRHGTHIPPPPPHFTRSMMPLGGPPMSHFVPPGPPGWPMDPYRDPYGQILRYNPLMEAAFRQEEERHKVMSMYAVQSAAHLRGKEPSPIPPPLGVPPPPHHRMQPSPLSASPISSMTGKPPSHSGMSHPISVDGLHTPKKEELSGPTSASSSASTGR